MTHLYDKTGAAFALDHVHDGTAYVRPLVKVIMQSGYGDQFDEDEDYEPADYLVSMDRGELFEAPPRAAIDKEIAAKNAELKALKSEAAKAIGQINSDRFDAERALEAAKRQLDKWMRDHRVLCNLGKLLDGQILYPLVVNKNPYHHSREIPRIPKGENIEYLAINSGSFETGKPWIYKHCGGRDYYTAFQFFDTEEERTAKIRTEFDVTCEQFRKKPDFSTTNWSSSTNLHYGTLTEWVKKHPSLAIPDDIEAMKAENDAELVEQRKAKLAAELAEIETQGKAT